MKKIGFSLIELLILLVIIGVIASIAIPGYCNYDSRAKVAEAIITAQNITANISAYAKANKHLPNKHSEIFKLTDNKRIESVSWYPEQTSLLVALNPKLVGEDNKYLVFTATGTIDNLQWQCNNKHALITDKSVSNKYLPHNCRSDAQ
jgi:type IV pilus assembly protein PilA